MKIAAVILNWNQAELTMQAAASVEDQVVHVYVVDNASQENDRALLRRFADEHGITLIVNACNGGYAGGNNLGIARAMVDGYDAILVMNNDAIAEQGAVATLATRLTEAEDVAAVAPTEVSIPSGNVIHTACWLDLETGATRHDDKGRDPAELDPSPMETGYVSGAAFLARSAVFSACGLFDERYFCYWEDTDWSVRVLRSGWRLEIVPTALVGHRLGASTPTTTGAYYQARNRPLFLRRTLGTSRVRALRLSLIPTAILVGSLLRRARVWAALRGAVGGWVVGLVSRA